MVTKLKQTPTDMKQMNVKKAANKNTEDCTESVN